MRQPIIPQLDEHTFLAWEQSQSEKFELHHGFVIGFAGGTFDHDRIAFNARRELERAFPAPCASFGSDMKVRIAADTIYYADAGVVCEETPGSSTVIERPRIVVEVLSPRTQAYDIVEKRAAYRGLASVAAYVIIHSTMRRVEVDRRGIGGIWVTTTTDDGDALIDGCAVALDALYARTSLEGAT